MSRWRLIFTVAVIIFAGLIVFSTVRMLFETDKQKIQRIIYAAKQATEQEDLFRCISFISQDYADKYGNDRRNLLLVAQRTFKTYDNIIIGIRKLNIFLDTDTARAEVEATGVARNIKREKTNIFETETVNFLIFFQKEEGSWKVIRLEFLGSQYILPPGII